MHLHVYAFMTQVCLTCSRPAANSTQLGALASHDPNANSFTITIFGCTKIKIILDAESTSTQKTLDPTTRCSTLTVSFDWRHTPSFQWRSISSTSNKSNLVTTAYFNSKPYQLTCQRNMTLLQKSHQCTCMK